MVPCSLHTWQYILLIRSLESFKMCPVFLAPEKSPLTTSKELIRELFYVDAAQMIVRLLEFIHRGNSQTKTCLCKGACCLQKKKILPLLFLEEIQKFWYESKKHLITKAIVNSPVITFRANERK